MNVVEQVTLAWQCMRHALGQMTKPALWGPWLLLGAVQAVVVLTLVNFAHPALSWLLAPLLVRLAGEPALHYPELFRLLPGVFGRVDLVVGVLLAPVMAGVSTALFAERFAGLGPARGGWSRALRRAPALILVNLPLTFVTLALSMAVSRFTGGGGGLIGIAATLAALGVALIAQALFVFGGPFIVIEGRGWISALASLPYAASRGMAGALFLSVMAVAPLLPLQQVAQASDLVVARGTPELVAWVVFAQIAIGLWTGCLLTGSITLLFQSAVAAQPEDA